MIRLDLRELAERLARVRAEEVMARAIGADVAAALRGGSASDSAGDATPHVIQASATMPGAGMALLGLGAAAALGWALSRPSSTPNLPGPTRAPPLMNQPSPGGDDGKGVEIPDLPANPDDLLQQGWEEITHPDAAAKGHRTFRNKDGLVIRADKGEPGQPGDRGRDHYHIENPNTTGKRDEYLDRNGRSVGRGSKPSHIPPGEKP